MNMRQRTLLPENDTNIPKQEKPIRQRKPKETLKQKESFNLEIDKKPIKTRVPKKLISKDLKEDKDVLQKDNRLENKPSSKKKITERKPSQKKKTTVRTSKKQIEETVQPKEVASSVAKPEKSDPIEESYLYKESLLSPSTYVIVLTPRGEIYIDPVPRYTDFINFRNFIASCPDNPSTENLYIKSEIKVISIPKGELIYSTVDGSRRINPFTDKFIESKSKVNVSGNLIFTGEDKGFSKKEAEAVFNWIVKTLQTPEIIYLKDNEET